MPKAGRGSPLVSDRAEMARTVGRQLGAAIKRSGRSQSDIASDLGISPSRLSNWVSGENEPPFAYLAALCRLTDVSADEILGLPARGPARLPDPAAAQLVAQVRKVQQRREAVTDELEDLLRLLQGQSKR